MKKSIFSALFLAESPDFLNVKQFPAGTFKSNSVQKVSNQQYTVSGDLAFYGATKPLTVPTNITGQAKGPEGELRTGAEIHSIIKPSEYGVNDGLPALGDKVGMMVAVEGVHK